MNGFWWVLIGLVPVVAVIGCGVLRVCWWIGRVAAGELEDDNT